MKMLLAIALLLGFASFTTAHAEWEILDTGSAVYAGASTTAPATDTATSTAPAQKNATTEVAKKSAPSN
jgi:hypothetical protein